MKHLVDEFIGRGEKEVETILKALFPKAVIIPQLSISNVIESSEYEKFDQEFKNHNCDFIMTVGPNKIAIEVNYKHGEKAAQKWSEIFAPLIKQNGNIPMTIEDYNCEFLFSDSTRLKKKNPWGSHIDVIRELIRQGINPNGSLL
jgi:myosin-crossreactive antigen